MSSPARPPIRVTIDLDPDQLADLLARAGTHRAREGLRRKFEGQADPDDSLSPEERERRVDALVRSHMAKMGRASGKARRAAVTRP
jgi:hypothetical protein